MGIPVDINIDGDTSVHRIAFHPNEDLILAALIDGRVQMYQYGHEDEEEPVCLLESGLEEENTSCRAALFSRDGNTIFSAFANKKILSIDAKTEDTILSFETAHEASINALEILSESTFASADDEGNIFLWDIRQSNSFANSCKRRGHDDYVSQLLYSSTKNNLLAVSGDGKLSVWDLRKDNLDLQAMSDSVEDELSSLCLVKGDDKVVCGSQSGTLNIYTWGDFGDISDRIPGHPSAIESMVAIDQNFVCCGGEDGKVRKVSILPNAYCGILGNGGNGNGKGGMPVTCLGMSWDGKLVGSSSYSGVVRFYDAFGMEEDDEQEEEGEEDEEDSEEDDDDEDEDKDKDKDGRQDDDEDDSDSDDSDSEQEQKKRYSKKPKSFADEKIQARQSFFADL